MPGEAQKIEALNWPTDDPLTGKKPTLRHGGKTFLARRADGACLFLNDSNGLCRIHERFGMDAKPLGCRVFPFQIAPTFDNERSVIARFDCPTVRKNLGALHTAELSNLRRYSSQLSVTGGFDAATCNFLQREQMQAIVEFLSTLMNGFETAEQRVLFIAYFCDALAHIPPEALDRPLLAQLFPGLKEHVTKASSTPAKRPSSFARLVFRALLGLYMRRDEDVLNGRAGRMGRTIALTRVVLGAGDFNSLGFAHPNGKLRRANLFHSPYQEHPAAHFDLLWRLIRNRLDSFQFLCPANGNRDFLAGLRSLTLLYPLILAVAKYTAASRGATSVEAFDIDYSITSIEHSFGRLPILAQPWARSLETFLLRSDVFPKLVRSV